MEANEVDVNYPQPTGQEDGTVGSIANGIMDMLDNTAPNDSGVVEPKPAETSASTEEDGKDEVPSSESTVEPDKYIIKWQGQDKEVSRDELINLAQQGFDYTQKTQALADERNQLAPIQGLATIIQNDPVKAAQIAAIISGQAPQTQQEAAPTKPTFDDPIEQLKWETKQEALAEIRKEMSAQIAPMQRMQVLNQVKQQIQADPDYPVVHQAIIDMVKAQPPAIQKTMYLQLDQDPVAYMDAFQFHKKNLATKKTNTTPPTPVKKETRAPILESGGVSPPDGIEAKAKQERISKQKAKALRSGDPTEIANWLKSSGAIDHLY